ncbi:MAG TPA: type IV toxin-antitoxin system AbiEi family antitoxin [Chitinophagaceae bacterium]|nr:type IV toxin-antitoxin system AbiEi family antitoxin [Chitinophagaceae bacterium]
MNKRITYNYLEDYIDLLRSKGKYTFTLPKLREQFNLSEEALGKALQRLKRKKEAARIRKEFYVIVPPEYRSRGVLPPMLFITELMEFLNRHYYTALLSAAAIYGAAHQQPQEFYVITTKPVLFPINSDKIKINFCYKKQWGDVDIVDRKTDTGYLKVSSPELTALDLFYYHDRVGGFNRVATVLEELSESMHAEKLAETASRYGQIAIVQRLGFILDEILDQRSLASPLLAYLKTVKHYPVLLRPQKGESDTMVTGNEWKVVPNIDIETDL